MKGASTFRSCLLFAGVPVVALMTPGAYAIVYRNDLSDATIVGLATQKQFSGIGVVANSAKNEYGTGTLIAPDWILTATHVVGATGSTAYFNLPGVAQTSGTVYSYSGADISLIHLNASPPAAYATAVTLAPLPTADSSVDGKLIWNVGYGEWGPVGGTASGFGILHAGTNVINSHDSTGVYFTNENTGAAATVYEASTGPGDSGGPMCMQVGNVWYVCAEVYGTTGDSRGFVDTETFSTGAANFLLTTIQNNGGGSSFTFTPQAAPTALTWDSDATSTGVKDGTGTWDAQRPDFYGSSTGFNYQWENAQTNDVTFGSSAGAGGVVTIAKTSVGSISTAGVTAHNLNFNAATSGNYTIAATGGAVLTLAANSGGDPTITTNVDASISAPISVSGAATTLTKAGAGTLVLSGSNTFTGTVSVVAGTLQGKTTQALDNYNVSGAIVVSSGATLAVNAGGSGEWTSANIDTLRSMPSYGAGANIGIDTTDGNFAYGNAFSGSIGLVKLGSQTLTLTASQMYTGTTQIKGGVLAVSGGNNRLPVATTVRYSGTSSLNLGGTTQSIAGLTVDDGGLTGSITNGNLNYTGTATLGGNSATFDLSGLTGFASNQGSGSLNFNGNPTTFIFAQGTGGNAITASALNVGTGGTNTTTNVLLGTNNSLNVDSIQIGSYHANGSLAFASGLSGASLILRGSGGGSNRVATLVVGVNSAGAQSQSGTLDLSGGSVDARIGTMTLAFYDPNSGVATTTGTFNMSAGTLDATSLVLAQSKAVNTGAGGTTVATVNQSGGLVRVGTLTLGLVADAAQTATVQTAVYNLGTNTSAGTLQATSIIAGALTSTISNTTATRTVNFNNGTIANFNDGLGTATNLNISGANSAANGVVAINLAATGTHSFFSDAGQTLTLQSTVLLAGVGGTLTKSGPGIMRIDGSATYTGATTINQGVLDLPAGGSIAGSPVIVNSSGTFELGASAATPPGIAKRTLTSLSIMSGGQAIVDAPLSSTTRQLLAPSILTFAGSTGHWQGLLDLSADDLDITTGSLSSVTDQIRQGFSGGSWQGSSGIVSSTAASNPRHLTAIGVMQNNQSGTALFTASHQFDGTTPGTGDILAKFTYYGDANLDGEVDGSDYSLIDSGYLSHATTWFNGDFNYDGVVNGSDYTLIDNAFNTQGSSLAAIIASPTAEIAFAVPEPTTIVIIGTGALGLLTRRRHCTNSVLTHSG